MRRIAPLALGAILLTAAAGVVILRFSVTTHVQSILRQKASQALPFPFHAREIDLNLIRGRVVLSHVLAGDNRFLLLSPRVEVSYSISGFLSPQVRLKKVLIRDPIIRAAAIPLITPTGGGKQFPVAVTVRGGEATIAMSKGEELGVSGLDIDFGPDGFDFKSDRISPPASASILDTPSLSVKARASDKKWDLNGQLKWPGGALNLEGGFDPQTGLLTGEVIPRGVPGNAPVSFQRGKYLFTAAMSKDGWNINGTLKGSGLRVEDLSLTLNGGLSFDQTGIRFQDLAADLPWGTATATGSLLHAAEGWQSDGEFNLREADVTGLLNGLNLVEEGNYPGIKNVNGRGSWRWREGDGDLGFGLDLATGYTFRGKQTPLKIVSSGVAHPEEVILQETHLSWPGNTLVCSGTLSKTQGWDLAYSLITESLKNLVALINPRVQVVDGKGTYLGEISGPLRKPSITGEAALSPFRLGNTEVEKASGPLTFQGPEMSSPKIRFSHRGGQAVIGGKLLLVWGIPLDLAGELDRFPLGDLVAMFVSPVPLPGYLSSSFSLKGEEHRSVGGGPVTLTDFSIAGIPMKRITGDLEWSPEGLTVKQIEAATQFGEWKGTLAIPFEGKLKGEFRSSNILLPYPSFSFLGSGSGALSIGGPVKSPEATGNLVFSWSKELSNLPPLKIDAHLSSSGLSLTTNAKDALSGKITLDRPSGRFALNLKGDLPPLPRSLPYLGKGDLSLAASLKLSGVGTNLDTWEGEASWSRARWNGEIPEWEIKLDPGRLKIDRGRAFLEEIIFHLGQLRGTVSGELTRQGPTLKVAVDGNPGGVIDLFPLPRGITVDSPSLSGNLTLEESWDYLTVTGDLTAPGVSVRGIPLWGSLDEVTFKARIVDGQVRILARKEYDPDLALEASTIFSRAGLDVIHIEGKIPVSAFPLPPPYALPTGVLGLKVDFPPDNPLLGLGGRFEIQGISLPIADLGEISGLSGTGTISGGELKVASLQGSLGGGTISGEGTINLQKPTLPKIDIRLKTNQVFLQVPDQIELLINGDFHFAGDAQQSLLEGEAEVVKGAYLRELTPRAALGLSSLSPGVAGGPPAARFLSLDLRLKTLHPFLISNNLVQAGVTGEVHLKGSLVNPQVTGTVQTSTGEFFYLAKRFRVLEGVLHFADQPGFDPFIDLQAETEVGEVRIYLTLQGHLSAPVLTLASDPPYSREEIASLLTIGKTELDGREGVAPAMTAALLAGGEVLGQIQEEARQALALSVFKIGADTTGEETQMNLTVGKKISDRLFLFYSQTLADGEGGTLAAEYRLLDFLVLTNEQDADGQNSFDLRFDFGF